MSAPRFAPSLPKPTTRDPESRALLPSRAPATSSLNALATPTAPVAQFVVAPSTMGQPSASPIAGATPSQRVRVFDVVLTPDPARSPSVISSGGRLDEQSFSPQLPAGPRILAAAAPPAQATPGAPTANDQAPAARDLPTAAPAADTTQRTASVSDQPTPVATASGGHETPASRGNGNGNGSGNGPGVASPVPVSNATQAGPSTTIISSVSATVVVLVVVGGLIARQRSQRKSQPDATKVDDAPTSSTQGGLAVPPPLAPMDAVADLPPPPPIAPIPRGRRMSEASLDMDHAALAAAVAAGRDSLVSSHVTELEDNDTNDVVRVYIPYFPELPDELTLAAGDLVQVHERFHDNWALGTRLATGDRGCFPLQCTDPHAATLLALQLGRPSSPIPVIKSSFERTVAARLSRASTVRSVSLQVGSPTPPRPRPTTGFSWSDEQFQDVHGTMRTGVSLATLPRNKVDGDAAFGHCHVPLHKSVRDTLPLLAAAVGTVPTKQMTVWEEVEDDNEDLVHCRPHLTWRKYGLVAGDILVVSDSPVGPPELEPQEPLAAADSKAARMVNFHRVCEGEVAGMGVPSSHGELGRAGAAAGAGESWAQLAR
ncbi:hypothetical protein AMAG_17920 [Allomyces macrogynus ATCC 38327]|uniref:SH3 domain-containing protein n=1 Tax=Allomyces macrogynus (strain ATCC 38327) TaxID=578462 RepID=A0A0L0S1Z5_ALLM3|nr:hypothetical protein AMAG_17920 [Allomyces macrogynus ATCC 38327]|eukprot:KNE56421.1 hypothetical protein AMAG_17920 [Allomyces macrogynus ATCC 38327]